jgi:hypothetical protein
MQKAIHLPPFGISNSCTSQYLRPHDSFLNCARRNLDISSCSRTGIIAARTGLNMEEGRRVDRD